MFDAADWETRDPGIVGVLRWFDWEQLPAGKPRFASRLCQELAYSMVDSMDDHPELTAGLRKLLEAKDCFVRAAIGD